MKPFNPLRLTITLIALAFIFSCSKDARVQNPGGPKSPTAGSNEKLLADGYVYFQSNAQGGNSIYIYSQNADGSLTLDAIRLTGGSGADAPLGSQGSVALSEDHTLLFAVNAGDNTISSFTVDAEGDLTLVSTVSSGGMMPVSITERNHIVYVVNFLSDNIAGYTVSSNGTLSPIDGSNRPLSGTGVEPGQILFNPDGNTLVVTEKATNKLTTFTVSSSSVANSGTSISSRGKTPFGFEFDRNNVLIVSNAANDVPGQGSATSYLVKQAALQPYATQGPVANGQTSTCWLAIGKKLGHYAYVTNTHSNTISSYSVGEFGTITLKQAVATSTDAAPIDLSVSGGDQQFVYEINSEAHTLGEYSRNSDGSLTWIGTISGLPEFAAGIDVF